MPNKNEKNWRSVIFSLKIKKEKSKTNIGEVKSPAPASAIGIMGITPKYRSMATTLKNVRTRTAFQFFGSNCSLAIEAKRIEKSSQSPNIFSIVSSQLFGIDDCL